ncbi:MAG TPA: DUF4258 domain-containing protein [Gemmataceae bacterium]|jgi:hypothetical protein
MPHDESTSVSSPDPARVIRATIQGVEVTIEFIQHAIDRMNERNISEQDVIAVLDKPDATGLPADEGRQRDRKNAGALAAIDVVYQRSGDCIRVFSTLRLTRRRSGRF